MAGMKRSPSRLPPAPRVAMPKGMQVGGSRKFGARRRGPSALQWVLMVVIPALLAPLLVSAGVILWWLTSPLQLRADQVEFSFESGTSPRAVAQGWVDAGVDTSPRLLYEWFRWSGDVRHIRAGSYAIDRSTSPRELLRKLVDGEQTLARVRFIEGWTFRQLRAELAKAPALKADTARLSEAELMAALGLPGLLPEGRFFPDTYAYSRGSSDLAVLKQAQSAMQQRLEAAWAQRAPDLPLRTPDDLLKLASIIEKESSQAGDRGKIAAVFHNRLRKGMPLQTDPTVIYGLGEGFDGNLKRTDLQRDTPYNTYTRAGLPPTPISMPGGDSLLAAVRPAETRALYFVARGDGSSEFSETLDQHNNAVNKFQRGGK
jgi:UPF0755 protein